MTYEYVCSSCGNEWEAEQSISAPPLRDCPKCYASTAKRQVSGGAGFILKGGGWYADGYGSKKADTGSAPAKPSTEPSTPAKTETSSEKKPEASSDSTSSSKGDATAAA